LSDAREETQGAGGDAGALRQRLEQAAEGLRYVSEADHPFDFVSFPDATAADLAPERFAAVVGTPGAPVQEVPLDRFFAGQIDHVDPADAVSMAEVPRFRALKDALRTRLPDLRVLRVGSVEMDCYLVGSVKPTGLAGLHTLAAET
jgi:hypothetical protein